MICIYGWWNINNQTIPIEEWSKITELSSWNEPDFAGDFYKNNIALGHLRNKLNSEDDAVDPNQLYTENNFTIVADARLDNRADLLKKLNISNNTISDTILILKAFQAYDTRCVDHLIGDFAFVIWDNQKQQLFGARDHIGVKPFNYYFKDKRFLFGSQRKSILAVSDVDKAADWTFIIQRMNNRMHVRDRTDNLYIRKLMPAHTILINEDGMHIEKYWELDIDATTVYQNEQDYVDHFVELFKQSIRDRMRGSSHISAHLSGGLDSSGVAAVGASITKDSSKTFHSLSYTFPEYKKAPKGIYNFNKIVQDQNKQSNIHHAHYVTELSNLSYMTHLSHEVQVCDGMSWSNNVRTEYEIQRVAKNANIGINLSGFLGDEIITSFCRPYYLEYLSKGQYFKFFKSKHNGEYKPLQLMGLFGLKIAKGLRLPVNDAYIARKYHATKQLKYVVSSEIGSLFNPDFIAANEDLNEALKEKSFVAVHESIPLSFKAYQRNHINRHWTSRRMEHENLAASNFNMEYRYPMADIRLLQYVLSVPIDQKRNDKWSRLLYRRSMKGFLIDEIRWGDKFNSYLKPLAHYYQLKEDHSLFKFWSSIKNKSYSKFLDATQISDNLRHSRELIKLKPYFILVKMIQDQKISIDY